MHAQIRLAWDQALTNPTGMGAPPWTWPRDDLIVDVLHRTLFSLATGAVADAVIPARPESSARRPAPGARLTGLA